MLETNTNNQQEYSLMTHVPEYITNYFTVRPKPESQPSEHLIEDHFIIRSGTTKPSVGLDALGLSSTTVDGARSRFVPIYAKPRVNWAEQIVTTIASSSIKSENEFQQTLSDIEEELDLTQQNGSVGSDLIFEIQDLSDETNAAIKIAPMQANTNQNQVQEEMELLRDKIKSYEQSSIILTHLYKEKLKFLQSGIYTHSTNVESVTNKTTAQTKSKRKSSKVSPNNSYNSSSEPSDSGVNNLNKLQG